MLNENKYQAIQNIIKITQYKLVIEKLLKISYFPIMKSSNKAESPRRKLSKELN